MIGKTVLRALGHRKEAVKRCASFASRASSTAPQMSIPSSEESSKPLPFFRTRSSPTEQSSSNGGQYYTVDPAVKKQLYLYGGIPKEYDGLCKTFKETCIMVREPALEIMHYLKSSNFDNAAIRYCLYGRLGTGKSLTLAHLLHYGFENNFLLVHVPWTPYWFKHPKEYTDCPTKEGFADLPIDAAAWLMHFKNQNAHLLADQNIITSQDWEFSKREVVKKGAPLSEIIEMGINRVKYSTNCIEALLQEVKQLSDMKRCKTLVVIDGFNGFYDTKTKVRLANFQYLPATKVTITSPFINITKQDWSNGAVIVSVDDNAFRREDHRNTIYPKGLLGVEGFEHLDPFIPVETKIYSNKEFDSCIEYYLDRRWIINPHAASEAGRKELSFLSNNNPYQLMKITTPL
ncbi:small ribosomal subunit protein mS29 [Neocloeon triangulifer]|uniref:small ribosomal subunit protein mS29 n=1 Tax=Neocloeon triangulifer TaxID=2078957 RepID=UPI00286ED0A2|nr:small ribosomal subunit protein mS29 [Neocloeon triangulifer]